MALQGTLDTFALPDVLRLLAATRKTGRLRITGSRGTGSVWMEAGEVVALEATHAPHATEAVDSLFELLRFGDGAFTFDAEARAEQPGSPTDVEILVTEAESLLEEWKKIEVIVPSLDAWVSLRPALPGPDVKIDQATWVTVVAVGSGATVRRIADELCLGEMAVSRTIRDLVALGILSVDASAPAGAVSVSSAIVTDAKPAAPALAPLAVDSEAALFVPLDTEGDHPAPPAPAPVPQAGEATDEDLARQLALLSPKAATAVAATADVTTDDGNAAPEAGDADGENRGLLLKFLSSVQT